ncbi:hypothetical protein CTS44_22814 [Comamonas thiooxydans]|nr:hypothetical protein CTS44_22814 [Comamonas thiooxydans]
MLQMAVSWAGTTAMVPVLARPSAAHAADTWSPKVPVRIVVPFAAGGTSDIVARLLATHLAHVLGQAVIVENRAGAGGNIGISGVARATPDGQTLLLASSSFVTNPALYPDKRPYDPVRQFTPISLVVTSPDVIVVSAKSPLTKLSDLLSLAKAKDGALNYATPGKGNSVHLGGELLWQRAKVNLLHVPYSGSAPAVQAVLSGQVDCALVALPVASPQIEGGLLRALTVGSLQRWPDLPQVPTIAESGFPGYRSETMQALFAPAGTPSAAIERINAEVRRILKIPDVAERLRDMGFTAVGSLSSELATRVAEEVPRWAKVAATGHIRAD